MLKKILFFILINFYLIANAQNNGATIHVFYPSQQTAPPTRAHLDTLRHTEKNCFKWNWSVLTRGEFLLNYERYLGGNFTLELGLGITYEDFLFEATYNSTSGDFSINPNYGSPSPGLGGEAGLRYYLTGYDNLEGLFIETTVSYRPYSYPNANFKPITKAIIPGYNFLDEQFKFGYSASHLLTNLITEFYVGVGLRNSTITSYEEEEIPGPTIFNQTTLYIPQTTRISYLQFLLGFKLGYPF